jgi:hypothetical protein
VASSGGCAANGKRPALAAPVRVVGTARPARVDGRGCPAGAGDPVGQRAFGVGYVDQGAAVGVCPEPDLPAADGQPRPERRYGAHYRRPGRLGGVIAVIMNASIDCLCGSGLIGARVVAGNPVPTSAETWSAGAVDCLYGLPGSFRYSLYSRLTAIRLVVMGRRLSRDFPFRMAAQGES